jgi:hypothetical protein
MAGRCKTGPEQGSILLKDSFYHNQTGRLKKKKKSINLEKKKFPTSARPGVHTRQRLERSFILGH